MTIVTAAEFSQKCKLPLKTIKRFCRDGILPHERIGRVYRIPLEMSQDIILKRMAANMRESVPKNAPVKTTTQPAAKTDLSKIKRGTFDELMAGIRNENRRKK